MSQRAVFLDRDGVINDNAAIKHVNNPDQFVLFPGTGQAIKKLNDAGFKVYVVTNQGGVGLGFMKEEALRRIHDKMERVLAEDGAKLDEIRYCPHKPRAGCSCRKPEPGMILDLAQKHDIDLANSFMVGDRDTDIFAGQRAGTKTVFLAETPFKEADHTAPTLVQAVTWILEQ